MPIGRARQSIILRLSPLNTGRQVLIVDKNGKPIVVYDADEKAPLKQCTAVAST